MASPAKIDAKFSAGEKVLCFHGPLIYEAKLLKVQVSLHGPHGYEYFTHYAGWSKKWDEWVPECRILKYSDKNLIQQKELNRHHKSAPLKTKGTKKPGKGVKLKSADGKSDVDDADSRSSTPILGPKGRVKDLKRSPSPNLDSCSDAQKKKKLKSEHGVESEMQFLNKVEVRVKIPDELKPWLVDDYIAIVKDKKLSILPAQFNVDQIMDFYIAYKKTRTKGSVFAACEEVSKGIKEYFNTMLGTKLLFPEERQQFEKLMKKHPDTLPSALYGATHLLRLFAKIGSALSYTGINEKTVALLSATFQDFLLYLINNIGKYFSLKNYE